MSIQQGQSGASLALERWGHAGHRSDIAAWPCSDHGHSSARYSRPAARCSAPRSAGHWRGSGFPLRPAGSGTARSTGSGLSWVFPPPVNRDDFIIPLPGSASTIRNFRRVRCSLPSIHPHPDATAVRDRLTAADRQVGDLTAAHLADFWGCSRFPECRATQPVQ